MAIITLRQLLHRPAPGGPISANDPLPVRLYGPNGQLIGLQDDALKVALTGSVVEIKRVYGMTLEADAEHDIIIETQQCRDLIITFRATSWNNLKSGDGIYWKQIVARWGTTYYGELRGSVIDPYQPRLWVEEFVSGGIAEVPVMSANNMLLRLHNGTGFERTFSYYVLGRV